MEGEKLTILELHDRYNDKLVSRGTRMLKGDRHRAEEIVQDIWLELAGQEANGGLKYDPSSGQAYTYLVGCLWKGVRDHYQRFWSRKEGSLLEGARTFSGVTLEGWGSVPAINGDPAHLVQARELGYITAEILSSLPETYKEAIKLGVIDELPDSKAAETAGVNCNSTMRARLRRARQAFRGKWAYKGLDFL